MGGHSSICHTQLGLHLYAPSFHDVWKAVLDIQGVLSFFIPLRITTNSRAAAFFLRCALDFRFYLLPV